MATTFRDPPLRSGYRADEIGVHRRRTGVHWPGWLLPTIGVLLLLAFVYWAFARRDREPSAPALTPQLDDPRNGLPDIPRPRMPEKPPVPALPKPALPDVPQGALPNAPTGDARIIEGELERMGVRPSQPQTTGSNPLCAPTDAPCAPGDRSIPVNPTD